MVSFVLARRRHTAFQRGGGGHSSVLSKGSLGTHGTSSQAQHVQLQLGVADNPSELSATTRWHTTHVQVLVPLCASSAWHSHGVGAHLLCWQLGSHTVNFGVRGTPSRAPFGKSSVLDASSCLDRFIRTSSACYFVSRASHEPRWRVLR